MQSGYLTEEISQHFPPAFRKIQELTKSSGFAMGSDLLTCSLLRTLAASKPGAHLLEIGTGTGLSTCWILDGMHQESSLISIDHDPIFQQIARDELANDHRLSLELIDGGKWIGENKNLMFDFVFADSWHGKFLMLEDVLAMLNKGGLYIIDDLLPQTNWPEGHQEKVDKLIAYLYSRKDFYLVKQDWASGIIIAAKK
ncbi:MAG: O-methyltransferase [Chitinophagales bacterium]